MYWDPTGHSAEATFSGQKLGANAAADNMAQREMRKVLNKWNPIASSVGDAARRSAAGNSNNGYSYSKKFETLSVTDRLTIAEGAKDSVDLAKLMLSDAEYNRQQAKDAIRNAPSVQQLEDYPLILEALDSFSVNSEDYYEPARQNSINSLIASDKSRLTMAGIEYKTLSSQVYEYVTTYRNVQSYDSIKLSFMNTLKNTEIGEKIYEDYINFNMKNDDAKVVQNSNFISAYEDELVFKIPGFGSNAFSFNALFIGDENYLESEKQFEKLIKHEKGHSEQYNEVGVVDYALYYFAPSVFHFWTEDYLREQGIIPWNDYYEMPVEFDAQLRGGNVLIGDNPQAEIWRDNYFDLVEDIKRLSLEILVSGTPLPIYTK